MSPYRYLWLFTLVRASAAATKVADVWRTGVRRMAFKPGEIVEAADLHTEEGPDDPVRRSLKEGSSRRLHDRAVKTDVSNCDCQQSDSTWRKTTRTKGKCIFFDLGANNGDTFRMFYNGTGDLAPNSLKQCMNHFEEDDYEAFLVEANPMFDSNLQEVQASFPGVRALNSTAVFRCGGSASFNIQKSDDGGLFWAGRLGNEEARQKVTVPRENLLKLLYENTIPDDHVVIKMDIEGVEWDIMPCLAASTLAGHVDSIYVEMHAHEWSVTKPGSESLFKAEDELVKQGVDVYDWTIKANFAKRSLAKHHSSS